MTSVGPLYERGLYMTEREVEQQPTQAETAIKNLSDGLKAVREGPEALRKQAEQIFPPKE
jgi:hypothetical protein